MLRYDTKGSLQITVQIAMPRDHEMIVVDEFCRSTHVGRSDLKTFEQEIAYLTSRLAESIVLSMRVAGCFGIDDAAYKHFNHIPAQAEKTEKAMPGDEIQEFS